MNKLHLTPAGEAIALTYLELITNAKLDPNMWIK